MSERSLQELLDDVGSPAEMLRNSQAGPNVYPGVPAEYTNWRDEQRSWQTTAVLFNQSFHMADLAVEGPDARALLSGLAVNSFENFAVDKAKHFVPCTPEGYVIGDVILFHLGENRFNLVGRAPALNWITYHAETGGYDVQVELDQRSALRTDGRRKSYRYQVQGPDGDGRDRGRAGRHAARAEVLQHDHRHDRREDRSRPAPRHGRPAGLGAVRPLGRRRRRARGAASQPARSSGCGRRAAAPTRRTRSSRAGSPRRCRPSTPARASGRTASGCRRPGTRAPRRSAGASSPTTSRTTTSRPGTSATAATSSSTTTSSAARRWRAWPATTTA